MRQPRDLVAEARAWFESFANREAAEPELTTLSGRMIDAIAADVPEIGSDAALREELRVAVHDGVGAYFSQGPHERPGDIYLPNSAKALGRGLARRGADIALLQRCYRTLQRISWAEIMTSACREITDPELLPVVLDLQWDHLSRTMSGATERAEMAFLNETRRQASSALTRRRELVEADERRAELLTLLDELLTRAKHAGEIREELTRTDVYACVLALRALIDDTADHAPDVWRRHLAIMLAGFRPAAEPLAHPPTDDTLIRANMPGHRTI